MATWTFAPTSTSRTRPCTGAVSDVSIFMLSVMATTSPACTSSPSDTGMETTTPGAYEAITSYEMDDFARSKIKITNDELLGERDTVKEMLA